jgi:uncharacterized Zn finger protein
MNINVNTPPTEKMNPSVDIKLTVPVVCEKCQCQTFQEAVMLRSVSAILSPSGKAGLMPVPVMFACMNCGNVNQAFLPPELRANPIVASKIIS